MFGKGFPRVKTVSEEEMCRRPLSKPYKHKRIVSISHPRRTGDAIILVLSGASDFYYRLGVQVNDPIQLDLIVMFILTALKTIQW